MNTAGDAADQVVRYSLEAGEVALKITGEAAKELAVLLYTILKEEKKTKGRAKLETLIRSGKPLSIFSVKEDDMKKFEAEAKSYGSKLWMTKRLTGKKSAKFLPLSPHGPGVLAGKCPFPMSWKRGSLGAVSSFALM